MVLVDTSVWIRFLANRSPYAAGLDDLLSRDEVSGHEFVYGELLIGDRGGRAELLALYEQLPQTATVPHVEVVTFARHRNLLGRGAGWLDIHLLASALVERVPLWTADSRLSSLAGELGIAFTPTL
jgi:predicted nucleic acid-binding protein